MHMTSSATPQKYEGKIATIEDFYGMKLEGWKETQGKDHFWKMSKSGYFPVRIPQKLVKKYPSEFGEKIPQSPDLYQKISEREEQDRTLSGLTDGIEAEQHISPSTVQTRAAPTPRAKAEVELGKDITPNEYILHDTESNLLFSIVTLENLHLTPEIKRYEIPFANLIKDAKGNLIASDGGGDKMRTTTKRFSLIDMAVRKLVEIYHKWQAVKGIEKERDDLRIERDELIDELNEVQYNYNDLTYATAIKIVSKR